MTHRPLAPPEALDIPERIETERLVLRAPLPGDGKVVNEAILETWEALHRWMPWAITPPSVDESEQVARDFRARYLARTDLPMFIFLRDGGTFIGGTGLHRLDWSVSRGEIGYWVRKSLEGRGYVSEAVRAVAKLALTTLGMKRVEIHCSHRNTRSQRVALACGFRLEGTLRAHAREVDGTLCDTSVYSLVEGDQAARGLIDKSA